MARKSQLFSSCLILTFLCCFSFLEANNEVVVGGRSGSWKIPSSPSESFTQWAQHSRFKVGDSIVFRYDAGKDSVLEVTKEAYMSCNTTNPISQHSDGNTTVNLRRPGPFYFISGATSHCEKDQKLFLVVVTPRRSFLSPAPSPAGFDENSPAVAPTVGAAAGSLAASVVMFVGFGVWLLI